MVEVSDLQIEEFAKNEFPGQPFFIGKGACILVIHMNISITSIDVTLKFFITSYY